ncbi:MAG: hypothetical protein ACYTFA_16770 [Planctomycetota bacterium]|jgi:hypothetical protein
MRLSLRRIVIWAGLAAGGGFLMSGPGTTCSSFSAESALVTVDACFIFDCQSALGGVLDPCDEVRDPVTGEVINPALLLDCPDAAGP